MGDRYMKVLAEGLKSLNDIKRINCCNNGLTPIGVSSLLDALQR